jgi:hypothetical protein
MHHFSKDECDTIMGIAVIVGCCFMAWLYSRE